MYEPPRPVVEVNVGGRCVCGCFCMWIGSPTVWRFKGLEPVEAEPETVMVMHNQHCMCDDDPVCDWGETESVG